MGTPFRDKSRLWLSRKRGLKSRVFSDTKRPVMARDGIPEILKQKKLERGDALQRARLRYYPSIDVSKTMLYAGEIEGSVEDAEDMLLDLGFRNNPTAYVEITEEHGPDDGSYSLQLISETGGRYDIPRITNQPSYWKRTKRQIHVTVYQVNNRVIMLSHEEVSAWLQPARHVVAGDATARIGVRDFRDIWFDQFGEELPGKDKVFWDTTH